MSSKTLLDYIPGYLIIPPDAFGISPSALGKFITKPWEWYQTEVLGEKVFDYSTSTVLGTIVHFLAEGYTKDIDRDTRRDNITRYLFNFLEEEDETEFLKLTYEERLIYLVENYTSDKLDMNYIIEQFPVMGMKLVEHLQRTGKPSQSERTIEAKICTGYHVCGTVDAVHNGIVIDYKTTSSLTAPTTISYEHKIQLLCYAYILRKLGTNIHTICIKYITHNQVNRISPTTNKPMKDYPTTVTSLTESITEADFDYIESILNLVADTVELSINHPEYLHIIWKDYRLKQS